MSIKDGNGETVASNLYQYFIAPPCNSCSGGQLGWIGMTTDSAGRTAPVRFGPNNENTLEVSWGPSGIVFYLDSSCSGSRYLFAGSPQDGSGGRGAPSSATILLTGNFEILSVAPDSSGQGRIDIRCDSIGYNRNPATNQCEAFSFQSANLRWCDNSAYPINVLETRSFTPPFKLAF